MKYIAYETSTPWPPTISRAGPWAIGPYSAPGRFRALKMLLAIMLAGITTAAWLALSETTASPNTADELVAKTRD